jgi:uncharacterized protein
MKISVKVKLNSREGQVEEVGPHQLLVKVKAPAQENRANQELRERLAEYYRIPKSHISIIAGWKSKQKIVKIEED